MYYFKSTSAVLNINRLRREILQNYTKSGMLKFNFDIIFEKFPHEVRYFKGERVRLKGLDVFQGDFGIDVMVGTHGYLDDDIGSTTGLVIPALETC